MTEQGWAGRQGRSPPLAGERATFCCGPYTCAGRPARGSRGVPSQWIVGCKVITYIWNCGSNRGVQLGTKDTNIPRQTNGNVLIHQFRAWLLASKSFVPIQMNSGANHTDYPAWECLVQPFWRLFTPFFALSEPVVLIVVL